MDISAQPYLSACLGRYRIFMGLLMNHEEFLRICGINLAQTYAFALEEYELLEELKSRPDTEFTAEWQSSLQEADQNLLQKISSILAILKVHHTDSHVLGTWLSFRESLRQTTQHDTAIYSRSDQAPQNQPILATESRDTDSLATYQATWADLQLLHSNLMALDLSHDFILPFGLFLGGLGQFHIRQLHAVDLPSKCHLSQAARKGLKSVVDFALQEEAQCLARSRSRIPGDTEYQCLLMGVAHLSQNPSPTLDPWLLQDSRSRQLTSAFFAMGCLAVSERVSFRWTRLLLPRWQMLTEDSFGPTVAGVILRWAQRA